ncbi:MAG: Uma2 family endonuclease [Caldilineaceae bacterium]
MLAPTYPISAERADRAKPDRPGWIPMEIVADWDENPYAYQTEEESMPAGGLHGQLLAYIVELLRHHLKTRGLMFLIDVFLLYRDEVQIKRRIAPDLLLMPFRFPLPSAYDLDVEPPPLFVAEVTSPDSHLADLEDKAPFYLDLGISTYLVIDAITPSNQMRKQIELHLWRLVDGAPQTVAPDTEGGFALPELGFRVLAEGQRLQFIDLVTDEVALDTSELSAALAAERRARLVEQRARLVEQSARLNAERAQQAEREARLKAEAEIARLLAEVKKLRGEA